MTVLLRVSWAVVPRALSLPMWVSTIPSLRPAEAPSSGASILGPSHDGALDTLYVGSDFP